MCGSLRVPHLGVHAVEDPRQRGLARREQLVQPHAVAFGADLPRVRGAHRREPVRVDDPGLEEADPAALQRLLLQVLLAGLEPQVGENRGGEEPLVAEVVDGEDRARGAEQAIPRVQRLEVEGNQRGLPVVTVEDLRTPLHALAALQSRAREQGEAEVLVGVVRVEARAVEEHGAMDEVHRHLGPGQPRAVCREDERARVRADRNVRGPGERLEVVGVHVDRRVERREDADVVPGAVKVRGERGGDVREPAGLGEGRDLAGDVSDRSSTHGRAV